MVERELKNGEKMVVKVLEPPLGEYGDKVGAWRDLREDLLSGELEEWLVAPYFVGEIGGEVVGSMAYYAGVGRPEVGLVEFVQTAEAHRRKGGSSALMEELVKDFRGRGGMASCVLLIRMQGICTRKMGFGIWWGMGCGIWRRWRRIGVSFALWERGGARGDVVGLAAFVEMDSFTNSMWGM